MSHELVIAVLAGLGGMLGWGLADFFAKKTIDQLGDILTLAWGHVFGTLALIIIVIYQWSTKSVDLPDLNNANVWLGLILFGVLQATVYFFVYKGFGKGQVTLLAPIFASFSGLTAVLSIFIFKESVSGLLLLILAIIFLGVLMISISSDIFKTKKLDFSHILGFKEVVIATLMASLWTLFWDRFVGGKDWLLYTMLMYFFMTVAIWAFVWIKQINVFVVSNHLWKFLIFIGLGEVVAYLAISIGYSSTSYTSIVALISGAFALPTVVLAYIFLKERVTRVQIAGCLAVICGIALLSVL